MSADVAGDKAVRVIRQHARTAALLGVDFVPAYTRGGGRGDGASGGDAAERHEPAPVANIAPPAGKDRAEHQRRLDEVRARYERDAPHRHFVTSFTNLVFGEGDPCARLMFVGEAPGAEEDRLGRPFVGRSGQLLDKMIVAMGLSRERVYIANVLKTRPPNNATPTSDEIARCRPYLLDQIAAVAPEVIVTLGLPAARALLQTDESMGRLRGQWHTLRHGDFEAPVMPTFHPAFLLRQYTAENRGKVWSDLQQAMSKLGLGAAAKGK
jgi:uracil-DNA glycosylase family 4